MKYEEVARELVTRLDADHSLRSPKRQQHDIEWVAATLRNAAAEMQAHCANACLKVREEYVAKKCRIAAMDCHDRISRIKIK